MNEIWILEAQRMSGTWEPCLGWHASEKDAEQEIANRSTGRYQIIYRVRKYIRVENEPMSR
jgi:hypothetical protein